MTKHPWLDLKNWAVLGASDKTYSYGYIISDKLLNEGYKVIPVTPKHDEVCGLQTVAKISDYDGPIDVVDFVVNPSIGIGILDEIIDLGIKKIMLQPGTASPAIIEKAEAAGIEVLESCILVLLSWK